MRAPAQLAPSYTHEPTNQRTNERTNIQRYVVCMLSIRYIIHTPNKHELCACVLSRAEHRSICCRECGVLSRSSMQLQLIAIRIHTRIKTFIPDVEANMNLIKTMIFICLKDIFWVSSQQILDRVKRDEHRHVHRPENARTQTNTHTNMYARA